MKTGVTYKRYSLSYHINILNSILDFFQPQLYQWCVYDVIKNMVMQIRINLPEILIWPTRPYIVSLYQLSSYLDQRKQSYGPKKFDNFLLCYMGKLSWWEFCAQQHGCHSINVWEFSKL